MARYPSGIHGPLPGEDVDDVHARITQITFAIDDHPIGDTASCANPECTQPIHYAGHGRPAFYCSPSCRARAAGMRRDATHQLELIERTLTQAHGMHGIPRDQLRTRARQLRWWLDRLGKHVRD